MHACVSVVWCDLLTYTRRWRPCHCAERFPGNSQGLRERVWRDGFLASRQRTIHPSHNLGTNHFLTFYVSATGLLQMRPCRSVQARFTLHALTATRPSLNSCCRRELWLTPEITYVVVSLQKSVSIKPFGVHRTSSVGVHCMVRLKKGILISFVCWRHGKPASMHRVGTYTWRQSAASQNHAFWNSTNMICVPLLIVVLRWLYVFSCSVQSGSSPLSTAFLHDRFPVARFLVELGAQLPATSKVCDAISSILP